MKHWPRSRTEREVRYSLCGECGHLGSEKTLLRKWHLYKDIKLLRELAMKTWGKGSPARQNRYKVPGACIVQNNWANLIHIPSLLQTAKLSKQPHCQGQRSKCWRRNLGMFPFFHKSSSQPVLALGETMTARGQLMRVTPLGHISTPPCRTSSRLLLAVRVSEKKGKAEHNLI